MATAPCGAHTAPVARTSLLIVDDHPPFRRVASALLQADGFAVLGAAGDAESGLAEARRLLPDVVLLDVRLPDGDGFDVAAQLTAVPAAPAVVLTSSSDDPRYPDCARRSGACGFVAKHDLNGASLRALLAGSDS